MTLPYIVRFAYDFHRPDLISGWPEWAKREGAKSERFDIEAKVAAPDLAAGPDEVKGADGAPIRRMFRTGYGQYRAQRTTMPDLCLTLTDYSGRQVLDKTGLTDSYDLTLRFTSEPGYGAEGRPGKQNEGAYLPDDSGPTIFTAVQEQLGLKLEPAKLPVDELVIDHVEQPSEN